jgi:sec-independent protein translocase protein TatC
MSTRNIEEEEQDPISILGSLFSNNDNPDPDDPSAMTLVEHLEELRWRIFKSLIALVVGAIIAFVFRVQILDFLTWPLPQTANSILGAGHNRLITTGLGEGFTTYLAMAVAGGFLVALPVLLYQMWAFISPGLYNHEKKHAVPFIIAGLILFLAGISLGYIVLQYPVHWLISFASTSFTVLVSAGSYFTFVAFFLLAFGIVFEIPLVLTFLSIIGIISSETLTRKRAISHVALWIAATVLTPGADPYSPVILGIAMSCLFELSIIFIKITERITKKSVETAA